MAKVAVLVLEGLTAELVKQWSAGLTNLTKMQRDGIWGNLESTIPPTTPASCICAQVGCNPGVFGFWDYYYRDNFSYNEFRLVDSTSIKPDPLYRILPKMAQKMAIINVPVIWPPPVIPAGYAICNPAPSSRDSSFTNPASLKDEIQELTGRYISDIYLPETRSKDIDEAKILKRIQEADAQRFALLKYFINEKRCDCVFTVVRGIDKMAHLFYRYFDEEHVRHEPKGEYANALKEHYKFIDKAVGEIRADLPLHTALLVYSDYGIQKLGGRININEWLIQEGYLSLFEYPSEPAALTNCKIDWSKTKAWANGSMGQIYINLKGRETHGIVAPGDYDNLIAELTEKVLRLPDVNDNKLNTQVFRRDDIHFGPYAKFGPDIFISFDEYRWNTNENVGYGKGKLYSYEIGNQRNDASHSRNGYFCMAGPDVPQKGEISQLSLLNIAPTILDLMGVDIPYEMEGESILAIVQQEVGVTYLEKRGEAIKARLEALGY